MSFAYLPLYTGDYLRDTRHLTPLRHGIYLLALMYCWDTQGPMPTDEQESAGICNCRSADEIDALRYVLQRYFVLMDDGWYNKRMTEIVAQAERVSSARSEGGLKSAEARREKARRGVREKEELKLNSSSAQVEHESVSPSPSPSPSLTSTKKALSPKSADDKTAAFDKFWSAYPRKVAKAEAAKVWKSRNLDALADLIVADVTRRRLDDRQWQDPQYIPHPRTYLSQQRWLDEIQTQAQEAHRGTARESTYDRIHRINSEIEARARAHVEGLD